ncbi:unnamed protein product [Caenorhabditis auriculariae]|uniref:Uncharacterized protein n=1 Tax=Caenorhabditis auriculariae TaxID=2777116 RepID=A0A8S1HHM3_9PELO|nr:unnamed protein product [Caenorhabditis auriculariae]
MPSQTFELLDYFAPLFVGGVFAVIVTILTIIFNFIFIHRSDEITAFEKLGAKYNLHIGPHRLSVVKARMQKHVDEDGNVF